MARDLDEAGDFGGSVGASFADDGMSDLLVGGQGTNAHVLLFFGTTSGYRSSPDVTFTGSISNSFGSAVVNAGDLDGDGLADIAIASRNDGNGKVYIFSRNNSPASWGTSGSWPSNLSDTQANYVITANSPLTPGSMDIRSLARLGNFDGTGTDDLAIAYDSANSVAGSGIHSQRKFIIFVGGNSGSICCDRNRWNGSKWGLRRDQYGTRPVFSGVGWRSWPGEHGDLDGNDLRIRRPRSLPADSDYGG